MKKIKTERITSEIFRNGGRLSKYFSEYQYRKDQMSMALTIANGLENNKTSIVEAGTGTGKSFAELVPTLAHILSQNKNSKKKQRVFVTTFTIALQSQLYYDDVPLLKKVFRDMGLPFQATLLKGRSNYLCFRKLITQLKYPADKETKLIASKLLDKGKVYLWDKEHIPFQMSDSTWMHLCSGKDSKCSDCKYKNKNCYYHKMKRKAEKSDLIIGNHALLLSDLVSRETRAEGLVPDYDIVVIDEAHHLEDVASQFIGFSVGKNEANDSLYQMEKELKPKDWKRLKPSVVKFTSQIDNLFNYVEKISKEEAMTWEESITDLSLVELDDLIRDIEKLDKKTIQKLHSPILQLRQIRDNIKDFFQVRDPENEVYWIDEDAALKKTPVEISKSLKDMLFNKFQVVMTSATIKFDKDLSVFAKKIGDLQPSEYVSLSVKAPFNYNEKVCFYIPKYALDANHSDYETYCINEMESLVKLSKGRAFLLFTSKEAMNNAHEVLEPIFKKEGYLVLKQGQMEKRDIIKNYKKHSSPVLFGTNTFWEGVDIRGDALSLVVIHKLPFSAPNPVMTAREKKMTALGRNAFLETAIFPAVTRYKQGFGRLIRHENDKGVFCVLDGRILSRKNSYGKYFLKETPKTPRVVEMKPLMKYLR